MGIIGQTYTFPLWDIMETVEIKWGLSDVRHDQVDENIYPPTERRSTCAEEWHLILTAGEIHNHFWWVLILNSGKVAMTFSHCWHPVSAAAVTTGINISDIQYTALTQVWAHVHADFIALFYCHIVLNCINQVELNSAAFSLAAGPPLAAI